MNDVQKNAIREADNYLKAAGLPTYSALTQQATPEPVGEPIAFVNWPLRGAPRLVWYSNKALQDAILKSHEGHIPDMLLYTRPAPGVPDPAQHKKTNHE